MENILTIVLSSTVISAIITTILNFVTSKRKDTVENIVKERKNWRDELKIISNEIAMSKNLSQLKIAVSKLKVRINPYGIGKNTIFKDSHIWEEIRKLEKNEKMTKHDLEKNKIVFVDLISCLLKYDWERSKNEIKGNIHTKLVIISLVTCYIFYSIKWFWNYKLNGADISQYITYCIIYAVFIAFSLLMINLMDKWCEKKELLFFFYIGVSGYIFLFYFWNNLLPNFGLNEKIDFIIFFIPLITLIYSAECKLIFYMNNVRYYIMASALSIGTNKINKKYKIYFGNRIKEFPSGEKIIFED